MLPREVRLLLVDDDPSAIQVMSRMLAQFRDQRYATSGEVALRPARESTPDLILIALASLEELVLPEAGPTEPGRCMSPGVRVLLVDDSDINLEVTRRTREAERARVRVASNGRQAVDLPKGEPDAVDIVLMDVQMPVLEEPHRRTPRGRRSKESTRRMRASA
jgi:CheY-like chemotaxis protein